MQKVNLKLHHIIIIITGHFLDQLKHFLDQLKHILLKVSYELI